MRPTFFKISDFCISDAAIPRDVADKIYDYHLLPADEVRHKFGYPVWVSKNSGYRPFKWEKNKGRDGSSQHTFRDKGAADYTAERLTELVEMLKRHTSYNRICLYTEHGFVHCDYASEDGNRHYFEAGEDKQWIWKSKIELE